MPSSGERVERVGKMKGLVMVENRWGRNWGKGTRYVFQEQNPLFAPLVSQLHAQHHPRLL